MNKETVRPQITAYESILLIFSELVKKGKTILRQDTLVSTLYNYKNNDDTNVLFEDIAFRKNLDTITSVDVEDSLSKLQTFGAIGRLNPAYEKIVIYISREEADRFLNSFNQQYIDAASTISEAF
ncbi:hypothetical protein D3Z58_23295 [Clostridiaceae bacterium]|nr:hypothetical protein [Clostridiaceae bacterium]